MTFGCRFAKIHVTANGMTTLTALPAPCEMPAPRKRYLVENSSPTYTLITDAFST